MGLREIASNTVQVYAKRMEPKEAAKFIRYMIAECKKLLRVYDPKLRDKTPSQNRYFHGVVVPFITEQMSYLAGQQYDKDEVRDYLKNRFGPKIRMFVLGIAQFLPKSITKYTVEDYIMLIDNCESFSVDTFHCSLPAPDSDYAKDKMDE